MTWLFPYKPLLVRYPHSCKRCHFIYSSVITDCQHVLDSSVMSLFHCWTLCWNLYLCLCLCACLCASLCVVSSIESFKFNRSGANYWTRLSFRVRRKGHIKTLKTTPAWVHPVRKGLRLNSSYLCQSIFVKEKNIFIIMSSHVNFDQSLICSINKFKR